MCQVVTVRARGADGEERCCNQQVPERLRPGKEMRMKNIAQVEDQLKELIGGRDYFQKAIASTKELRTQMQLNHTMH